MLSLCLAANNILLTRKRKNAFLLLVIVLSWKWQPRIFIKKQIRWSNDKTIIELGYRKISWFVTVLQMSYLLATDKSRYFAQPCPRKRFLAWRVIGGCSNPVWLLNFFFMLRISYFVPINCSWLHSQSEPEWKRSVSTCFYFEKELHLRKSCSLIFLGNVLVEVVFMLVVIEQNVFLSFLMLWSKT